MGVTKLTGSQATALRQQIESQNSARDAASASPAPKAPSSNATPPVPPSPPTPQTSPQGSPSNENHVQCPYCSGSTLVTKMGKTLSHISGWIQKSFSIKVPTGVLTYLQSKMPVSKTAALKGPCKSCGGEGSLPDPAKKANDAAQQAANNHKSNAEEIAKLENKLAPHGGNRHTLIQGCDLLEVGLGMNDVASYTVLEGAGRRNKRLVAHSDLSSKGAPMFFEGAECNYVQGTNPPASPGGHYFIKCSNKFSVMAGAQGIDLTTGGPVTISGGITRISGPEITIGTQTGPLSLEGEVVNITGKSIELAPSDGDLCVRGNISSSANIRVGGHTHSQSMSFVHGSCVGYNGWTDNATPKELGTGPAMYGSGGVKGITHAALELANHAINIVSDPMDIKNAIGVAALQDFVDKVSTLAYQSLPVEKLPTGFILPGTPVNFTGLGASGAQLGAASGNLIAGPGVLIVGPAPVPLFNFPHTHIMPSQPHCHSIRLPAIDISADTSEQLLAKQGGLEMPVPLHKSTGITEAAKAAVQSGCSIAAAGAKVAILKAEKALGLV